MNKTLIASAMLLATSAAYSMDLDDSMQEHIDILKAHFFTLKPIAKEISNGAIHAYHSPKEKTTHVCTIEYKNGANTYNWYHIHKDEKTLTLCETMGIKDYDQIFQSFEQNNLEIHFTKLPLGEY